MGQYVDSIPGGVHDALAVPAIARVSANSRVRAAPGAIGIQTDVLTFTGVTTSGIWTLGALRCRINGIPAIHQTSIGVGVAPSLVSGTSGPLMIVQADTRVRAL